MSLCRSPLKLLRLVFLLILPVPLFFHEFAFCFTVGKKSKDLFFLCLSEAKLMLHFLLKIASLHTGCHRGKQFNGVFRKETFQFQQVPLSHTVSCDVFSLWKVSHLM